MTKKSHMVFGSLAVTMTLSLTASAQTAEGFSIERYQPSEVGSDWFVTDSLDLRGSGRLALGVVGDWAHRPLVIYDQNNDYVRAPISHQVVLHAGAALIAADRIRFALSMPVLIVNRGVPGTVDGVTYQTKEGVAAGDLRGGVDVRVIGEYGDVFTTALGAQVHVPTGKRSAYASDGKVRLDPHWLTAGDIGVFTYATSIGFDGRFQTQNFAGNAFGPEITFAAAAGFRVANKKLVIGPELSGSTVATNSGRGGFLKKRTTPLELVLGTHLRVGDVQLGGGFSPGLTRAVGTPDWRVLGSLVWFPEPPPPPPPPVTDRDGDGIGDAVDACPDTPGEPNGNPELNGCPPPKDSDEDGIVDKDDACPAEPGVHSDDPAKNGCPLPKDRDNDGIVDTDDACPDTPGVKSDDPAKNGCPLPKDTDGDGIVDTDDACPNDPGPANDDPKKNGCPKAIVTKTEVKILERIEFDTAKATIRPESVDVLEDVANVLEKHPELEKIEVQGHTDNRGAAAFNRALSNRRAKAVKDWLVKRGIDASRLTTKGYGPDEPIDSNATDEGRQNNRRVQFIILKRDESAAPKDELAPASDD